MGQVRWSMRSSRDLESIGDYIAKDSPYYAVAFVERLLSKAEELEQFPERGRVVPEFKREDIRELIFQSYRIVYRLLEDGVFIVSISHASMDMNRKSIREKWEIS